MEKFLYKADEKDPKINVWFAFPAIRSFALSSLGYLSIFQKIDTRKDIFAERIYTDTKQTQANVKDVDIIVSGTTISNSENFQHHLKQIFYPLSGF